MTLSGKICHQCTSDASDQKHSCVPHWQGGSRELTGSVGSEGVDSTTVKGISL